MEGNLQITCPLTRDSSTAFLVYGHPMHHTGHGSMGHYGHSNHGHAASE